jgi:hypothetical protein
MNPSIAELMETIQQGGRLGGDLCRTSSGAAEARPGPGEHGHPRLRGGPGTRLPVTGEVFAEAEPSRARQPDDWQRFRAESLLGASLAGQKKYAEAEPLLLEGYRGMLTRREQIGAPAPPNGPFSFIRLGENPKKRPKSRKNYCGKTSGRIKGIASPVVFDTARSMGQTIGSYGHRDRPVSSAT